MCCYKGRLEPGRMFLVDTAQGRIISDEEIKRQMAAEHTPTASGWTNTRSALRPARPPPSSHRQPDHETILQRQQAFGYTFEDLRVV
jgi:hypothetical protein